MTNLKKLSALSLFAEDDTFVYQVKHFILQYKYQSPSELYV